MTITHPPAHPSVPTPEYEYSADGKTVTFKNAGECLRAAQAGDEPMPWNRRYDLGASIEAAMLAEIRDWRAYAAQVSPRATADVERVRDLIAAEVANNWPMRKYSLEEIEIKLGEIDIARLATTKPGA